LVCGAAVFVCALYSTQLVGRLVAVGWVCACIAVLPAALLAHRFDVHNMSWLVGTARERIVIWNHTAQQTLKAPILGRGADMTYVLGPMLDPTTVAGPDEKFTRRLSIHAHNVFLQTWFELGLVGATLLTLAGLALLRAIKSISLNLQPYAYATFTSAMGVAASSYGMWQNWFVAMFALTAVLFALARLLSKEQVPQDAP
jgi:O-antigen ligase